MNMRKTIRGVGLSLVAAWSAAVAHDPAEEPAAAARVRHVVAGEGHQVWVVGDTYTFKVTGEDTGGRLFVFEAAVPPAAGPPPHVHHDQDESFYLLEGELEVLGGEEKFAARAGSFVYVPKGTLHTFRNISTSPAKMLIWTTPAGLEQFFLEVGQPARPGESAPPLGPDELEKTIDAAPRHGLELRLPDAPPQ